MAQISGPGRFVDPQDPQVLKNLRLPTLHGARTARVGAKVGRIVRVLRLIRIVPSSVR